MSSIFNDILKLCSDNCSNKDDDERELFKQQSKQRFHKNPASFQNDNNSNNQLQKLQQTLNSRENIQQEVNQQQFDQNNNQRNRNNIEQNQQIITLDQTIINPQNQSNDGRNINQQQNTYFQKSVINNQQQSSLYAEPYNQEFTLSHDNQVQQYNQEQTSINIQTNTNYEQLNRSQKSNLIHIDNTKISQIENQNENSIQINQNYNLPFSQQNQQQSSYYGQMTRNQDQNSIKNYSNKIKIVSQTIQPKEDNYNTQQLQSNQNQQNASNTLESQYPYNYQQYQQNNQLPFKLNEVSYPREQEQIKQSQYQYNYQPNDSRNIKETDLLNSSIQTFQSFNETEKFTNYESCNEQNAQSKIKTTQVLCKYCQKEIQQKYTLLQCQHFYCNDCLKELLRLQSQSKNCFKYECVCSKPIKLQLFSFQKDRIVEILKEKLIINQINELKQNIQKLKNVKTCRNLHCEFFVIMKDDLNKQLFYCPKCLQEQRNDQYQN